VEKEGAKSDFQVHWTECGILYNHLIQAPVLRKFVAAANRGNLHQKKRGKRGILHLQNYAILSA